MFYRLAEANSGKLDPWALKRLRIFEQGSRFDNFVYEIFDLAGDIIFVIVLFDQAGVIVLPSIWDAFKAFASVCNGAPPVVTNQAFILTLAIASACIIGLSSFYRITRSIYEIYWSRNQISGVKSWLIALASIPVAIVDPWSGTLVVNQAVGRFHFYENKGATLNSEKNYAKSELLSDFGLIILENIPQLVIQLIYFANTKNDGTTTVAFYISILTTVMHLLVQLKDYIFDISYLWDAWANERKTADKDEGGVVPTDA